MFGMSRDLQRVEQRLSRIEAALVEAERREKDAEGALGQRFQKLHAAVGQHDMAIENLLDGWEELREERKEESAALLDALDVQSRNALQTAQRQEQALLALAMEYHDQLYSLRRAAARLGNALWEKQFALAGEKLAEVRVGADIQVVGDAGIPVSYALHEVLDAVPTEDTELAGRVAEVYACGYVYQGKTLRRAKVSAYRLAETEEAE